MPKPVKWKGTSIINSWEDIYGVFREEYNLEPTREQIIKAFRLSNQKQKIGIEYGMTGYWIALDESCGDILK